MIRQQERKAIGHMQNKENYCFPLHHASPSARTTVRSTFFLINHVNKDWRSLPPVLYEVDLPANLSLFLVVVDYYIIASRVDSGEGLLSLPSLVVVESSRERVDSSEVVR